MESVQAFIDMIVSYIPIVTSVVGTFAIIATATPNQVDDKIVQVLMDIINFMAGNFGNASNK